MGACAGVGLQWPNACASRYNPLLLCTIPTLGAIAAQLVATPVQVAAPAERLDAPLRFPVQPFGAMPAIARPPFADRARCCDGAAGAFVLTTARRLRPCRFLNDPS